MPNYLILIVFACVFDTACYMPYTYDMRAKQPGWIDKRVKMFEKRCLARILRKTQGNIRQAAKLADIRRSRLYKMMAEHGLSISDFRTDHADPR